MSDALVAATEGGREGGREKIGRGAKRDKHLGQREQVGETHEK